MVNFKRNIEPNVRKWLFKGKIVVFYGARQVGKTTFSKYLLDLYKDQKNTAYFNCEDPFVQNALIGRSAVEMKTFLGDAEMIVFDEAQSVLNIGMVLKILHDAYPDLQIIATGSSSFDLANKINEPLTGRSIEFQIYPLSILELSDFRSNSDLILSLPSYLKYGLYPEIVSNDESSSRERIMSIARNYLFKDILNFEGIKDSNLVYKILKALAYQLGGEVSFTKLASLVKSNMHTVERYISILEKSFIIFSLPAFSNNHRKEIKKSRKFYFYDLGIRNALIENFTDIDLRSDRGGMWENFFILEMMKNNDNLRDFYSFYFWRTYDQQEIDLIMKKDETLKSFELKWSANNKVKLPLFFEKTYPEAEFNFVNKENFLKFLL